MLAILIVGMAVAVRLHDLSRTPTRTDEMNFVSGVARNISLLELWKNPPWLNQMPLADSLPVVWARVTGQTFPEDVPQRLEVYESELLSVTRQPFAWLGALTVMMCMVWMWRRRGAIPALLLGVWLGLLPFHVYHSREAYYYAVTMLGAAGLALRSVDLLTDLKKGLVPGLWRYVEWALWLWLTCMGHMSAWIVAAYTGLLILVVLVRDVSRAVRLRQFVYFGVVMTLFLAAMSRWIYRAVIEMVRAAEAATTHIGYSFQWVAPRVVPFFLAGANVAGYLLATALLGLVAWLLFRRRKATVAPDETDYAYLFLTWMTWGGIVLSYLYILMIGGGKGKLAYFSVNLPAFLTWVVWSIDCALGPDKRRQVIGAWVLGICLLAVFAMPVKMLVTLDGKPVPYRKIQAWMNDTLPPGTVAIVDRWLEPWNELRFYQPQSNFYSFTIPDEPYETYVQSDWRGYTQRYFEESRAQAFIRLARNHEERARSRYWKWPERGLTHKAVIENEQGLWLRKTGFAPVEDFYAANTNRLRIEVFYDTRSDMADKARIRGASSVYFYDAGWTLFKPWQYGDFTDYRILENGEAVLEIHWLESSPKTVRMEVSALAVNGGGATLLIGGNQSMLLHPNAPVSRMVDVKLEPGINRIPWKKTDGTGLPLIQHIQVLN